MLKYKIQGLLVFCINFVANLDQSLILHDIPPYHIKIMVNHKLNFWLELPLAFLFAENLRNRRIGKDIPMIRITGIVPIWC